MKTTLVLDDALVDRVRALAKDRGVSMSSVVEEAILRMLAEPGNGHLEVPRRLATFRGGGFLVDIADRNALHDAMDDL